MYLRISAGLEPSMPESFLWLKGREDQIAKSKNRKNRPRKRKRLRHPPPSLSSAPRQRVGSGRDLRQLSRALFAGPLALSGIGEVI